MHKFELPWVKRKRLRALKAARQKRWRDKKKRIKDENNEKKRATLLDSILLTLMGHLLS